MKHKNYWVLFGLIVLVALAIYVLFLFKPVFTGNVVTEISEESYLENNSTRVAGSASNTGSDSSSSGRVTDDLPPLPPSIDES